MLKVRIKDMIMFIHLRYNLIIKNYVYALSEYSIKTNNLLNINFHYYFLHMLYNK
jgi:hypothetical protein